MGWNRHCISLAYVLACFIGSTVSQDGCATLTRCVHQAANKSDSESDVICNRLPEALLCTQKHFHKCSDEKVLDHVISWVLKMDKNQKLVECAKGHLEELGPATACKGLEECEHTLDLKSYRQRNKKHFCKHSSFIETCYNGLRRFCDRPDVVEKVRLRTVNMKQQVKNMCTDQETSGAKPKPKIVPNPACHELKECFGPYLVETTASSNIGKLCRAISTTVECVSRKSKRCNVIMSSQYQVQKALQAARSAIEDCNKWKRTLLDKVKSQLDKCGKWQLALKLLFKAVYKNPEDHLMCRQAESLQLTPCQAQAVQEYCTNPNLAIPPRKELTGTL